MSARSRYAVRLLVVTGVIALVIGLGFVWRVSPAASIVSDGGHGGHGGRLPAAGAEPIGDRFRDRGSGGLSLGSIDDLVQTMVIGVAVMGIVVVIDRVRRHRRPIRPRTPSAT